MALELSDYLEKYDESVLNLGCGKTCPEDQFGIDIIDAAGVDRVCDLNKGIPVKDNTFDKVLAIDFLEHLKPENKIKIIEEIYRVLKPGGEAHIVVPSTDGNSAGAFQDPTHLSYYNQNSFMYYLDDEYGQNFRSLYNIQCWFKPLMLETYYNQWAITYVRAILQKKTTDND